MSNTVIKIKNSSANSGPPTNPSLALGEMAYSHNANGNKLYIGTGIEDQNGIATSISIIGGKYFTDMLDHILGELNPSSAIITDSNSKIDVLNVDNLTLNANTISSTDTNGDIILDPHGTGFIRLDGPVSMTGDFGLTGDMSVTNLDVSTEATLASLNVDAVNIDGSTISTTTVNANLTIAPNGTGGVVITSSSALTIPSGTDAERPTGVDGMIRYNETSNSFEGYHNLNWNSLGGVKDVDGDTYILAETSPSADNDDLEFYTAGIKRANLDATGFVIDEINGGYFQVGKIKIDNDTISSLSGGVIYIDPNPAGAAGSVVIEGDLTVNGTTTTVNSTIETIDGAIFTLGGDTALTNQDGLDKGISFQWFDTLAQLGREGFFGWDLSDSTFKFIPDATFSGGTVSGSLGDVAFANGLLTSLSFDGTGTGYVQNGVMYTNTSNDVAYAFSSTEGHVLQINASGVPYFGIIEGGTY